IPIDALHPLTDGTILGDSGQYQGFFRFNPVGNVTTPFGAMQGVTEHRRSLINIGSKAYISGYPNGPLYEYDPAVPWNQLPGVNKNAKELGHFSDGVSLSGIKRSQVLAYSSTKNRIYTGGTRDRSGSGAGVGYYDFATKKFAGRFDGLEFYADDIGLVVFDALNRIVVSGTLGDNS